MQQQKPIPDLTPFMGTVLMVYPSKFDEQKMVVVFSRPGTVPAYEGDRSGQVSVKVDRGKEGRFVPGLQVLITPRVAMVKGQEVVYYNPPREMMDGSAPPVDPNRLVADLANLHVQCTQAASSAYGSRGMAVPPGAAGAIFIQACQVLKEGVAPIAPPASVSSQQAPSPYDVPVGGAMVAPPSYKSDEIPF